MTSNRREVSLPDTSRHPIRDMAWIACGPVALIFFLIFLAASHFLPPISPKSSPRSIVDHYRSNETGMEAGVYILVVASILWPMYSLGLNNFLSNIPGINPNVLSLQSSCGTAAGMSLAVIAPCFGATLYRLERDPTLTQLLNDLSWLVFTVVTSQFATQEFAISIGILSDTRAKPLIPHWVAWINSLLTLTYIPAYSAHCVREGSMAWNGAVTFWLPIAAVAVQTGLLCFYVWSHLRRHTSYV